ncbi:MAG TPA: hypothetical protein DIU05_02760 [Bacteroidetes bacterium]|jgi:hypothetical protein|nr:hypothetical protein [Bacteroidota bacterium]
MGRLIQQEDTNEAASISIDTSNMPSGLFSIRISTNQGEYTKRFIIGR